jgi:hypothetical protein
MTRMAPRFKLDGNTYSICATAPGREPTVYRHGKRGTVKVPNASAEYERVKAAVIGEARRQKAEQSRIVDPFTGGKAVERPAGLVDRHGNPLA